jgi:hypothetical protein
LRIELTAAALIKGGKYADASGLQACANCPYGKYQDITKTLGKSCLDLHKQDLAFDPTATQPGIRNIGIHAEVTPTHAPTQRPTEHSRKVRLKQVEAILLLKIAPHIQSADIVHKHAGGEIIREPFRAALSAAFAQGLVAACTVAGTQRISPYAQDITISDAHVFAVDLKSRGKGGDLNSIIVRYSMAVSGRGTENDDVATWAAALSLRTCLSAETKAIRGRVPANEANKVMQLNQLNTSLHDKLRPLLVQHNITLEGVEQLKVPTVFPFDTTSFHLRWGVTRQQGSTATNTSSSATNGTRGIDAAEEMAEMKRTIMGYRFTKEGVAMLATIAGIVGCVSGMVCMLKLGRGNRSYAAVRGGQEQGSGTSVERSPLVPGQEEGEENALPEENDSFNNCGPLYAGSI